MASPSRLHDWTSINIKYLIIMLDQLKKHIIINCEKSNMITIESLEMDLYNMI